MACAPLRSSARQRQVYRSTMRVIAALLFLLTPLQPFAAVAVCLAADHSVTLACGSSMGEMSGREGVEEGAVTHAAGSHTVVPVWSAPGEASGCSVVGLCDAPAPGIAPVIIGFPQERPTDMALHPPMPPLGPGTRPAPPPHPPKA
jgi:hypothetical protein